jgi:hypothetical protein
MMTLFHETRERIEEMRLAHELASRETDRRMKETDHRIKETNKQIANLGNRVGELVESMVEGGVVRLFRDLGYTFTRSSRRMDFGQIEDGTAGEVDLFLENGEYALLVEVKTNLTKDDVDDHAHRLSKYRVDANRHNDHRKFLGAVGGGVVSKEVQTHAQRHGFFVIRQSGENVEVLLPSGEPRVW